MGTRKARPNAVCRKLEKGNGSVAGMKMLLPVDKICLVEVVVRGIDFGHWARNGVSVKVEPVHGAGHLAVDAPKLVDDTPEARDRYFRKAEAAEFFRNNKPRTSNERDWRSCLTSLRAGLTEAQREVYDRESLKVLKSGEIRKASCWELEKVLPVLVAVKFDLLGEDVPDED